MILLCGRTCSGKDTIKKELINIGMNSIVTYTTRPPREGEKDGETYHFISKDDFFLKKKSGFFAETTLYNVATGDTWYYGTAFKDLENNGVIIVNPCGLKEIKKNKMLNTVSFYIMADNNTIRERLQERGDNPEEADRRLYEDEKDFCGIDKNIDFAFRNDLGLKPKELAEMIFSTYQRVINLQ